MYDTFPGGLRLCPDEHAEGIDTQAQFKVVIRRRVWWGLLAVPDVIKLHGMGCRASCLFIILDGFHFIYHFLATRED